MTMDDVAVIKSRFNILWVNPGWIAIDNNTGEAESPQYSDQDALLYFLWRRLQEELNEQAEIHLTAKPDIIDP